jgi:hypothetical protein
MNAEVDAVNCDHALLALIDLSQPFNLYDHCGFIPWRIFDYMQSDRGSYPRTIRITILPKCDADSMCRKASRT